MSKWAMYRRRGSAGTVESNPSTLYLAAIESEGGVLSGPQRTAVLGLYPALRDMGIWDKCIELAPFVGNTLDAAVIRMRDPAGGMTPYNMHAPGSIAFVLTGGSAGIQFDGSTSYLSGGPTSTQLGIDCAVVSDIRAWPGGVTTSVWGVVPIAGWANQHATIDSGSITIGYLAGSGANVTSGAFSAGRYGIVRPGASELRMYRNGTSIALNSSTVTAPVVARDMFVAATNTVGTATNFAACRLTWMSAFTGLSGSEMSSLDSLIQLFQGAFGRS